MWKPLIRCSVIGGIIVFLWMTVAWMVLPMHKMQLHGFADSSEVSSTIMRYSPYDGIYVIPSWAQRDGSQQADAMPFIFVNVRRGVDLTNMVRPIAVGLITQIIGAFLITYLLLKTKSTKYWDRVWFVTIAGLFAGIIGVLPAWNWWYFPISWVTLECFDLLIGWFIGGLVIAKLARN